MRNRVLLAFLFILLIQSSVFGKDEPLSFKRVEDETYRMYREGKWDSLIMTGRQALRQDIDYFFLRLRMGIAYSARKEYFPAARHLEKARSFNSEDTVVNYYLYFAYKSTGRQEEAGLAWARLSEAQRRMAGGGPGFIEAVDAEGGYTFSSDRNPEGLENLMGTETRNDSIYGERDLYGNSSYFNIGLHVNPASRIRLTLRYSFLNFNKTRYFQYGKVEDHLVGIKDTTWGRIYNYEFPWVVYDTQFRYNVKQHEFHLGASLFAGRGFSIRPAFHMLQVSYPLVSPSFRFDTVNDPAFFTSFDSTLYTFPFARLSYSFPVKDTSFYNYLAALSITKDFGWLNLGLAGSWSNLNGMKQLQAGISATYFPLGNLDLYGTTTLTGFSQKKDKRLLFSQAVGGRLLSQLWAEGNFALGDFTNANISNGSIVYNNSDKIKFRGGGSLFFIAGKHLKFSLVYQYSSRESLQVYYTKEQDPVTKEISEIQQTRYNPYRTHTIIGGITWKL